MGSTPERNTRAFPPSNPFAGRRTRILVENWAAGRMRPLHPRNWSGSLRAMNVRLQFAPAVVLVAGLALLTGCPPPPGSSDENNPLIQEAVGLASTDTKRAIELLERALGGNPGLARAHRELGNLHYQSTKDFASAIYHFQKYLELDPESQWRTTIEPQIKQSKIDLARAELDSITDAAAQRRIQSLLNEKAELTRQLEEFSGQIAALQAQLAEATNLVAGVAGAGQGGADRPPATAGPGAGAGGPGQPAQPVGGSAAQTHRVVSGDTLASIGRKYGFDLAAMKQANPGINHDRINIGQVINLPRRTGAR